MAHYYALEIKRSAQKSILRLSKRDVERVRDAIDALADDPTPRGASSVAGTPFLRVRVGNYRIVYEVRREEETSPETSPTTLGSGVLLVKQSEPQKILPRAA